jgi:Na+/melibiose symporter-like transporter
MPDMPLFFNSLKTGLGLWRLPLVAFIFEITLLFLAGFYLLKGLDKRRRLVIIIILLIAGYTAMFFAPSREATPTQVSIISMSLYAVFTALAYWSDRVKR